MSNHRGDGLDRPVGEQWVELSRDEKKKICDALINRNEPDVMQEFASLVRFTRGYFHQQPTGSLPSSNGTSSVPIPSTAGSRPSDGAAAKRENDEVPVDMSNTPRKKARKAAEKGPASGPRKRREPMKDPDWDYEDYNYVSEENELDEQC